MSRANQNAKEEFLSAIGSRTVKCAIIQYEGCSLWEMNNEEAPLSKDLFLRVGHNEEQFKAFVNCLDFNYDAGYGGQELFGTVWFEDSVWMDRGEYDGSEWWQTHTVPEIPQDLL